LSRRILIVEDNEINLKLVEIILQKAGYLIVSARNAEHGIELANSLHPDLILMDIHLPGMDGLVAIGILKKDPSTREIPVLALTALAMKGDEDRIIASGSDGYIQKPVGHEHLLQKVSGLLSVEGRPDV
jgi:two-component system cell cycle response regulator DivK